MVNPIYQQDEELLLNPFGSKYLSSGTYTDVNSNEFIVQEDTVISVLTGGDASISENSIDYKTSMNLSGVTLKKGALIVAPVGEAFKSITIDSGSIMAYNCVVKGEKPGSFVGLLDDYPDAVAAYSLRKLKADYTGAAIEVRKTVGGVTTNQDIGFDSNGELDTASLLSFVGAGNDGFVVTWYDQSGEGNDVTQVAADSQPIIVSSGILESLNGKPSVNFIDTGDKLNANSTITVNSSFTVFNSNAYSNINYVYGSDSPIASGLISGGTAANGVTVFSNPNVSSYNDSETAAQKLAVLIQNANTNIDVNNAGLISTSNIGQVYVESVGNRAPTRSFSVRGNIQECVFFSDDKLATRAGIQTNINDYYNIYWDGSQTGLLDDYPNAAAAYSLRALNSAYTGPAIRVQSSGGGAPQDIGFLYDGSLDTEALLNYVGSNDGSILTWYDQSGGGNNATQATASKQPKIVNSGVVNELNGKPTMTFLSPFLMDLNLSQYPFTSGGDATEKSIFAVAENDSTVDQNLYNIADTRDIYALTYNRSGNNTYGFLGANYGTIGGNITGQNIISSFAISPSSETFNNTVEGVSSNLVRSNFNNISIGSRGGSYAMNGSIQEMVMYESNQSTNRTAIETNINTYYTIYV